MTEWDNIANKAAEKTDEELAQGLDKLMSADLKALFPNPADEKRVAEFVKAIKVKTERNEKLAAFKAISVTMGLDLAKLVKKAMFVALVCFGATVHAQEAPVHYGAQIMEVVSVPEPSSKPMLDFGSFFQKSRVGYSVNQHMERSTVLYSAFKRYSPKPDVELLNLNFGYDMTSKHPVVMMGVRLDNADRLLWDTSWSKKHIETASIPVIEFGPYFSAWPRSEDGKMKLDTWYGFVLAMGLQ